MVDTINLLIFFFLLLFFSIFINTNTSLHLLLSAELLWISLYGLLLFVGIIYDNLNLLSLTFFFLIFSAIEFGIGLVLLMLQHIFFRSLSLITNDYNSNKFLTRLVAKLYNNKFFFK